MSFFKDEKGSVSLIVITLILLISVFGVTMLTLSIIDYKTSYNLYWKKQSNGLSDYAITEYRERLNEMFYSTDSYEIDNNLVDKMDTSPQIIEENGVTKAKIEYHDIELSTLTNSEYRYVDDSFSTGVKDGAVIYKTPPIDNNFSNKNYLDIVQSGRGNTVTDGIFNPSLNSNEFFVGKAFVDNNGIFEKIEIQSYVPLTSSGYETALISKDKATIESLLPVGQTLDKFSLNDDVSLTSVWDENMLSPVLFVAISIKDEKKVHYFKFVPRIDSNLEYLDTIDFAIEIPNLSEILSTDIKSAFDKNMNASLFTTTIFYKTDVAGVYENGLVTYTGYYPVDDSIDLSRKISLTKTQTVDNVRVFSSDLYWNDIYQAPELLMFVVTDNTSGGNVNYNGKIDVYKSAIGIDSDFSKVGTLNLEPYFDAPYYPTKEDPYINYLSTSVYWVDDLNDGYINLYFVAPNKSDVNGQDKMFYLETNVVNFDINEVNEIDLPSLDIKKVGRVSSGGVSSDYRELLAFIDNPIVRETSVVVTPPDGKNITITSYEKDGVTIASRTEIRMEPEIEVATLEYSNVRFTKSFKMKDLKID